MSRSNDIRRIVPTAFAAMLLAFPLRAQIARPPQLNPRPPALPGAPPTGVTATAQGPRSVALSWVPPAGATGYWVLRAMSPDTVFYTGNTLVTGTSAVDLGLLPGRTFAYKIKAVYTDPNAPRNPGISTAVSVTLPPAPQATGLTATLVAPDQLKLAWNALSEAGAYQLYVNGALLSRIEPMTSGVTGQPALASTYTAVVTPGTYVHKLQVVYRMEGVSTEVTSDLATAPSVTTTIASAPPPPIRGFADTHTHQFANLGFGGLLIWGNAYGPIEKALPWCNPAHGVHGLNDIIGNVMRKTALGHEVGGSPEFDGWPKWNTLTHQQMHSDWLYRALQGGLKLMVMHAVNNELLCGLANKADGRTCNDMEAVDLQLQAAKDMEAYTDDQFGGPGKGWYRIVYSPQQAREAIAKGQLAVVLGIEVDNLFGCRPGACDESTVDKGLKHYHDDIGVRHLYPIHLANNAFGGFALYDDLFNVNNKSLTGSFAEVADVKECSASGFKFQLGINPQSLLTSNEVLRTSYEQTQALYPREGAHCNKLGLTPLGEYLITQMMNRGMIIDIDHMSKRAIDATLNLTSAHHYPVIAGHAGLVGTSIGEKKSEAQKTDDYVGSIAAGGGLVSLILHQGTTDQIGPFGNKVTNDCSLSSKSWAQSYLYAVAKMGGPTKAAVGLATDQSLNDMVGPRFGPEACGRGAAENLRWQEAGLLQQLKPVVYPITPLVPGPALGKSVSGKRTFDYNFDGLAHVGMLPDFIQDLMNVGLTPADLEPLFRSAEAYIAMWERAVASTPRP
jgi:microsomal dipeptidase-like Zn-dependent dipeptidase